MNKKEIPLMFCFDNNYVIPAAVAFYSLLEHCNKDCYYKLYILHTDITVKNQEKLKENVKQFSDFSELIFINMENRFEDLWQSIATKGHFSKEVMYKVLVASIFEEYDKIIVSDVDVVFLNDISESYDLLDCKEDYYLAGIKMIGKMKWYLDQYLSIFTEEEVEKLSGFCGGYIIFNLKKLREDNMEKKFIECFQKEGHRINQMEQDVLNLCCYPKTKRLPLKYIACSYMWDIYKTEEDKQTDIYYSKEEIEDAMQNTVQLHYATSMKPWNYVDSTKSEVWFKYLAKTNYLKEYLRILPKKIVIPESRIRQYESSARKKSYFKYKLNNKYGNKLWFRAFKYVYKNPFFLFKGSFYKRIASKIKNKLFKKKFSLIIVDDVFPSIYSPFRYTEFTEYLKEFESIYVLANGNSLKVLNENRSVKELIKEYEIKYPEFKGKIFDYNERKSIELDKIKSKVANCVFLENTYNSLNFFEKNNIPFVFTLYPGGGFIINNRESNEKLKAICKSKCFKKVIVTQKLVYDYLINKNICPKDKVKFIYGIVTPEEILNNSVDNKKYYKNGKENLDICFVAHKYSEKGMDKGYDLFIDSAKILHKKYKNINFHVVGGFNENEIDVSDLGNSIKFYGIKPSEWLRNFYSNMDLIVSPNRPFVLNKGSFDGFPTGSCTEAMINGVVLLCSDELKLNIKFKNETDLIIIKPDVTCIVEKIEYLYKNPEKILEISRNGRNKTLKIYSKKKQINPRIKLIKKVGQKGLD